MAVLRNEQREHLKILREKSPEGNIPVQCPLNYYPRFD